MSGEQRVAAAHEAYEAAYHQGGSGPSRFPSLIRAALTSADEADRELGIYRVSLDAAVEAAAEQDCEDWENCTVRDMHRKWAREALTAAVIGGAQ